MTRMKYFNSVALFIGLLTFSIGFFGCGGDEPYVPSDFSIDDEIERIMAVYNIPGVQLAIVRNEKLVLQKSFGLANEERGDSVTNKSLFRIASISKPITLTGILKLRQKGLLDYNANVFGEDGILDTTFGTKPYSADIEQITVRHLAEHLSGGWTNDANDPMFLDSTWSHAQIIDFVLDKRPLDFEPGTEYMYSNFGYCLLGRIIEKVSGQTYADFIKSEVLVAANIESMKIGKNSPDEKWEKEVTYYNHNFNYSPYRPNVERFDANGGWIASASDLLKFITVIDRGARRIDIVDSTLLSDTYLGNYSWKHSGALPGTSAMLEKYNDEFSFAVLANGNSISYSTATEELTTAIENDIYTRTNWISVDLFE